MDVPGAPARVGLSEAAAQKRVSRSVEKLRVYFADRGLVMSLDAIAAALAAGGVAVK